MKLALKIMFIIFLVWMLIGMYLIHTEHEKSQLVMGLGVFYFSFFGPKLEHFWGIPRFWVKTIEIPGDSMFL